MYDIWCEAAILKGPNRISLDWHGRFQWAVSRYFKVTGKFIRYKSLKSQLDKERRE
jgi:hypothetical protein